MTAGGAQARLGEGVRRLLGGVLGATLGTALFHGLSAHDVHAVAVPEIALGLGAGWLARRRSIPLGLLTAVLSVACSIAAELWLHPFSARQSLGEYLAGLPEQTFKAHLNLAVAFAAGFWFGMGRHRPGGDVAR